MMKRLSRVNIVLLGNIIAILYMMSYCINTISSGDSYFMITTGRYIINNGIPHTNPWALCDDMPFVAQQWLYCVWLYFVNMLGSVGWWLSIVLIATILYLRLFRMFRNRGYSFGLCLSGSTLCLLAGIDYMLNLRPEAITIVLVLTQCLLLEQHIKTQSVKWLYLMPILTLLEINLHASMWILHFCVLIPYVLPAPALVSSQGKAEISSKRVLFPAILMCGSLFINPYGIDAILYIFRSISDPRLSMLNIMELKDLTVASPFGFLALVCIILLAFAIKGKWAKPSTLYMSAGLLILVIRESRSVMFIPVVLVFLLRDLFGSTSTFSEWLEHVQSRAKEGKDRVVRGFQTGIIILFCIDIIVCLIITAGDTADMQYWCKDYVEMVDMIEEQAGTSARVFTGFNSGAYLEYRGFDNIFMDARPEMYFYSIDGTSDIVDDAITSIWGIMPAENGGWVNATEEYMKNMLSRYRFDYFIVGKGIEPYLYAYLVRDGSYRVLLENDNCALFVSEVK